jgi:hypothetical protein
MQLSYVPLANLALNHIGEDDRISAPDEDSKPARAVARAWELTRLFVLAAAHWSFAVRTVELVARVDLPEFPIAGGLTAFPLPPDLVTLVEIREPKCLQDPDSYSIEGGPEGTEILCDELGPIVLRYVRDGVDIADPSRWTPAFAEAFAFRLAWQISDALAADKARKDRAFANYQAALKLAKRTNARMKAPIGHAETPWSAARRTGFQRAPGT